MVTTAIQCFTGRPDGTGLAGWILPTAIFSTLPNASTPWRPCEDAERVTNAESAALRTMFGAERQAMMILRTAILASLPKGILALAPGFDHAGPLGTASIAIPALMTWLRATYGRQTASDLTTTMKVLHEPWDGGSVEALTGRHLHAHAITAAPAYNQPLPEAQKVGFFLSATLAQDTDGTVAKATRDWYALYPDVKDQKFGGDDGIAETVRKALAASKALNSHVHPTGPSFAEPSVSTQAFTVTAPAPRTDSTSQTLQKILSRLEHLEKTHRTSPSPTPRSKTTTTTLSRTRDRYCWTHGLGFHTSAQCNTPTEGHISKATEKDRRGGSRKGF